MTKILSKIFLGFLAVIVILTAVILIFSYNIIWDNYENTLIQNLIDNSKILDYYISPLLKNEEYDKLDSLVKLIGNDINIRITIIGLKGVVHADSKNDPKTMENHSDRPEIVHAMTTGEAGTSIRHSYTVGKDMLYVAVPLKFHGELIGISRLSVFMNDVEKLTNTLKEKVLLLAFFVVILSLLIAFVFSRTITHPIKILTEKSKQVAEGDFTITVQLKNNDEIKLLADNFNEMTDRVNSLFTNIKKQKDQLNSIISSIQEGLVVLDDQGKILLHNEGFANLVSNSEGTGKFYWEILRDNNVIRFIKKALVKETDRTTELQIKEDYYLCSANHIATRNELVLIFYNITEMKRLENIKKDFVTNVSHELRTPLTVIKGYVETIEDSVNENNKKFLSIIKNHTDRLINIVQDLLVLSKLEEKTTKIEITEFDLNSFFDRLFLTFEKKLTDKKLNFMINIGDEASKINADEYKLEQMFINLIDNAIKYTDFGGIIINASKKNSHFRFEIIDSGIGIPEAERDRIFERFYTVDKSRSRQNAGTGLGLSIVKHIVNLHNGKISVETNDGKGSKFIILFPII